MKGGLFITGTDTDVGKTWVTVRLIEALREPVSYTHLRAHETV